VTASAPSVRVDRTGKVWRGDRLLGYVDRSDRWHPFEQRTWRYVLTNGWASRSRYPTRAAAVDALAGAL
jgi:hypothetical protein